jgi:hypothetical protein
MLHDPQLAIRTSLIEGRQEAPNVAQDSPFVLRFEPEHDNPGVLIRWIGPDLAEIQIERD